MLQIRRLSRRRFFATTAATVPLGGITRRAVAAASVSPAATTSNGLGYAANVATIYTGAHSHWLQPWREMVATRSLLSIENGIGLNTDPEYPQSLSMFAAAGFRHVRVGLLWSQVSFRETDKIALADNSSVVCFVRAAKAAGLRPLVMLQAMDQGPCPYNMIEVVTTHAVSPSDTSLTLASVDGLKVGTTGLTGYVTSPTASSIAFINPDQVMAASLITAIKGKTITLSKPVGIAIPAGCTLVMNKLAFKPWSEPGSADYEATMEGWLAYVGAVSTFMQRILKTGQKADLGFDLEVWNETSFGSAFLDINNYYASPIVPEQYVDGIPAVIPDLVARTAAYVEAHADQFAGVRVTDGFASVSPMQASSTEPAAVTALSKHPYPSPTSYPASDPGYGGLDCHGNPTSFVPSYTIFTHEYYATAINPFTLARDITATPNSFGGITHGQNGRVINGSVSPVSVWLTEVGTPTANEGVTNPSAIEWLTAKGTLRALFFYLGIGVERAYVFSGVGDTTALAMVPSSAPTAPTLVLGALSSALAFIRGNVESDNAGTLASHSFSLSMLGGAPRTMFVGNGTAACPDFVQPSDYVLIPIQVSAKRTALVHWFTGLDMREDMDAVPVEITIGGLPKGAASLSSLDPLTGEPVRAVVSAQSGTTLTVVTAASDRPCILVIDQS